METFKQYILKDPNQWDPFSLCRNLPHYKEWYHLSKSQTHGFDGALIGGAPQIMKVYRHANCMPYAIYWPSKESREVSLIGRPLLDYERSSYLVMDPDTLKIEKHTGIA